MNKDGQEGGGVIVKTDETYTTHYIVRCPVCGMYVPSHFAVVDPHVNADLETCTGSVKPAPQNSATSAQVKEVK